jgi:hypothetical protein
MRRLLAMLVLVVSVALAQDWVVRYPARVEGASAHGIIVDSAGNSFISGYAQDIVMVKYRPDGGGRWDTHYSCAAYDNVGKTDIGLDSTGNILIAASVRLNNQNGFLVAKYDPARQLVWDRVCWHSTSQTAVSGGCSVTLVVDPTGGIYVVGSARSDSTSYDIAVGRLDATGGVRWCRLFDGQRHESDNAQSADLVGETALVVTGRTKDASGRYNAIALSYDSAGNQRWLYVHRANTNFESHAYAVEVAPGGGVYLAGWQRSAGQSDKTALVVKLNSAGDSLWSRTDSTVAYSLAVDSLDNVMAVGDYLSTKATMRGWRYDADGQLTWRRDLSSTDTARTYGRLAVLTYDQGVYASGYRYSGLDQSGFLVARFSASGQMAWARFSDETILYENKPLDAVTDGDDNILLTGVSYDWSRSRGDFMTMKFRPSGAVAEEGPGIDPAGTLRVCPFLAARACEIRMPGEALATEICISDASGRRLRSLGLSTGANTGNRSATWSLTDDHGRQVPNGVYFIGLDSPERTARAKVVVQR